MLRLNQWHELPMSVRAQTVALRPVLAVLTGLLLLPSADRAVGETHYELVRKIENPKGLVDGSGDEFGISLAHAGDAIAIGAYRENTGEENAGAAFVFDSDGSLKATIHNPTPEADDWFAFHLTGMKAPPAPLHPMKAGAPRPKWGRHCGLGQPCHDGNPCRRDCLPLGLR